MIEPDFRELEKLLLALGDKTRLRLLSLMAEGEVPVNFLAESLGESQPKVSRHLAYLRNAGVVNTRRDGKWIYYGISYPHDESLSRVLETVVQSVVKRVDGEYVNSTGADDSVPQVFRAEDNIYGNTDINATSDERENNIYASPAYELNEPEAWEPESEEMDIFLL